MKQRHEPITHGAARVPELDGIRGAAIILVIVFHYLAKTIDVGTLAPGHPAAWLALFLQTTWTGVDLFFVLSGYLIGGLLLKHRSAVNYFQVFYVRRFCRILPLYLLMIGLLLIFHFVIRLPLPPDVHERIFGLSISPYSYLSFTQNIPTSITGNFGPFWLATSWSLAVEEQFYLVIPLVIRYVPYRRLPWVCAVCIVGAPMLRTISTGVLDKAAAYVLMPCRVDALMIGVLAAYMSQHEGFRTRVQKVRRWLRAGVVGLVLVAVVLTLTTPSFFEPTMQRIGFSSFALLFALILVLTITRQNSVFAAIFRAPLLQRMGGLAYGLYLFHDALLYLVFGLVRGRDPRIQNAADLGIAALALVLTVGLAHLSWRYFEQAFVSFGRRWKYRARTDPQSETALAG